MDQVIRLTTYDVKVRKVFLRIMHMLEQPSALFQPFVVWRVAKQALSWRTQKPVLPRLRAGSRATAWREIEHHS